MCCWPSRRPYPSAMSALGTHLWRARKRPRPRIRTGCPARSEAAAAVSRRALALLLTFGAAACLELVGAQQPCRIHGQCSPLWFCSSMPFGAGVGAADADAVAAAAGTCEPCWKCCLLPNRFNTTAATNADGALVAGGCTWRCGCNAGRACRRDSDCASGLFCMDRGPYDIPVCKPCTECEQAGCAPQCPGGRVSRLLGPPPRNATSHDPALRDAAVFLSLALEPWRTDEDGDRTQVRPEELLRLLRNESWLLLGAGGEAYNFTASYTLTASHIFDFFVSNVLVRVFSGNGSPTGAGATPLKDVAKLLLRGSRALLCPALPDPDETTTTITATAASLQPPSPPPRTTGPGCPCNLSTDASSFRCPPGFGCSRAAHLGLSFDVLSDPTWARLGGECVPCTAGQLCAEGVILVMDAVRVPDCPSGYYCPTPRDAVRCPAGFFCPARTRAPITCTYTSLLEASTPITRREEGGLSVFWHLWRNREAIRGNYCPEGSSRPDTTCEGGHYCPNASVQLLCPRGAFCKPQSVRPVRCLPLVRCPAGSMAPDGRPLAGLIFVAVDAAVLLLYGMMRLGGCLRARIVRGWILGGPPAGGEDLSEDVSDQQSARGSNNPTNRKSMAGGAAFPSTVRIELGPSRSPFTDASAAAAKGPFGYVAVVGASSPAALYCGAANPFALPVAAAPDAGDEWDDAVLLEPNEAPVYGKVLQGRYYSFKALQSISIRFSGVWREGRLKDVAGAFDSGKLNVVMGPSGCGKSTLIELLSGRLPGQDLDAFRVTTSSTTTATTAIAVGGGGGDRGGGGGVQPPPHHLTNPNLFYHMNCNNSTYLGDNYELPASPSPPHHHEVDCGGGGGAGGCGAGRQRKRICLSRTIYRSQLGFVPQEDMLHADLTVRENLAYSARLKLPRSVSRHDVDAIIDETLDMLDMEHLRHSRTGSVERKSLSGGQRKRVSIGVEIVGKRPVMFMDEPTSGLDATTSYELCVLLSQIAKTFRINVIAVIHQPSYRCFRLFDRLLLLGRGGELTFHGRPRDCVTHFRALGYRVALKDCAETILDIVYHNNNPPLAESGEATSERPVRGNVELVLKPTASKAHEGNAAEAPQTAESVYSVAWSPDGRTLALGTGDGTVQLCDADAAQCVEVLKGHTKCVRSVSWRPCGFGAVQLVSGGDDMSVRLWRHDDTAAAAAAAAAPGGSSNNSSCAATLEGHIRVVTCVTWSPDGRLLASAGSWDKTVRLWDPAGSNSHSVATLEHRHAVSAVAWSPDGRTLASGSNDGAVWLWETEICKCTATLKGHTDWVRSVAWSGTSKNLVSGSSDGTLRLWDVMIGECLAVLEGHESYINSVAWSPTGFLVASGGGDRCVRLWDAATGICIATFEGHSGAVTSVAWSPVGGTLASGSGDGTVRFWDTSTGAVRSVYATKPQRAGVELPGGAACRVKGWLRRLIHGSESQTPRDVQLLCLIHRNLVKSSRVPLGTILLDVVYLQVAAFIVGCIQGSSWGPSKVPANLVMAYLVLSMLAAVTHLKTFSAARMVQLYEHMSGVSVTATFLSSNITDMGWIALSPAVYFSVYYFINAPAASFLNFFGVGFLVCWWSSGLSYIISTSVMPQQHHTTVAVICTLIMGAFLHGLSPSLASARNTVMEVVLGVSYNRWAMEAITIQELRSGDRYAWNEAVAVQSSVGVCDMDRLLYGLGGDQDSPINEDEALAFLQLWRSYKYDTCDSYYTRAQTVLFCMGVGMRLVAWAQMKFMRTWTQEATDLIMRLRKALARWKAAQSAPCDACGVRECCRACSGARLKGELQDNEHDDAPKAALSFRNGTASGVAAAASGDAFVTAINSAVSGPMFCAGDSEFEAGGSVFAAREALGTRASGDAEAAASASGAALFAAATNSATSGPMFGAGGSVFGGRGAALVTRASGGAAGAAAIKSAASGPTFGVGGSVFGAGGSVLGGRGAGLATRASGGAAGAAAIKSAASGPTFGVGGSVSGADGSVLAGRGASLTTRASGGAAVIKSAASGPAFGVGGSVFGAGGSVLGGREASLATRASGGAVGGGAGGSGRYLRGPSPAAIILAAPAADLLLPTRSSNIPMADAELASLPSRQTGTLLNSGALTISVVATCTTPT